MGGGADTRSVVPGPAENDPKAVMWRSSKNEAGLPKGPDS